MPEESPRVQYGSGGRGREYLELPTDTRQSLFENFNVGNNHFPGHLGFRILEARRGYARLGVENRQELSNPAGMMHGGASFGLADTAVAVALVSIYGTGNALLTVEMKINYLEPIFPGEVTAEAYVLRSSRSSAYAEADIWSAGKLAARASTTYMIRPMSQYRKG
jgi:acyl-CoA thioesterase